MKDLEGDRLIPITVNDLKVGQLTVMGVVTEKPEFSQSGKTVLVTVKTHSGRTFTDRRSARAKIYVWA